VTQDINGTPVTEEEAAHGLGFKDVFELRRWQTDQGNTLWEAQVKLKEVEQDRDRFLWHLKRHGSALKRIGHMLDRPLTKADIALIKLAIGVATNHDVGQGMVDWKHELGDFLETP
jgi:hypothetical protein